MISGNSRLSQDRPLAACWAKALLLFVILISSLVLPAQDHVLVADIQIQGRKRTKPWVISRELTFEVGDSLPVSEVPRILQQNRRNLFNLNLFQEVTVSSRQDSGQLYVIFRLLERFPLSGQPLFAIEERNSYDIIGALRARDFHRLVYGGTLVLRNLTGGGEWIRLGLQWGFSRRVRLRVTRPNLFRRWNADLQIGGHYTQQPEIMVGTVDASVRWVEVTSEPLQRSVGAYIGVDKRFDPNRSLYGEVSYDHYRLADSIYAFTLEGVPHRYVTTNCGKERFWGAMLLGKIDRRDWRGFPLDGYQVRVMGRLAGGPGATTQFAKVGVSWSQHLPLPYRFNFAYGVQGIYTFGRRIPFFEKSQIGILRYEFPGISTELRGYEPYVIDGTALTLAKAELKFAVIPYQNFFLGWMPISGWRNLATGCYLSAFVDMGHVSDHSINNQDKILKEKMLIGYGVGLNLIGIYDMLLRIELARNHLGQQGIYLHGTLSIK